MAANITEQFICAHSTDKSKTSDLYADLAAIKADRQFSRNESGLRALLNEPGVGFGLAKAKNKKWMVETFSDRREARRFFGQPLAPLDSTGLAWTDRPEHTTSLLPAFDGPADEAVFILTGDEGTGKSWLVANAWHTSITSPLLVVFIAAELKMPVAPQDVEGILIRKLAEQTSDTLTDAVTYRWQRRFKRWRANPKPNNVRFSMWVDGLNQAQDFDWPRWIDGTARFLEPIGGRLIVTTNERHYEHRLRRAVISKLRQVIVAAWSDKELTTILTTRGIAPDRLSADVFAFLCNPRILGIAAELLAAREIEQFDELTVGRLLFEHILRCETHGATGLSADAFAKERWSVGAGPAGMPAIVG